jgi:hypothetical protein
MLSDESVDLVLLNKCVCLTKEQQTLHFSVDLGVFSAPFAVDDGTSAHTI